MSFSVETTVYKLHEDVNQYGYMILSRVEGHTYWNLVTNEGELRDRLFEATDESWENIRAKVMKTGSCSFRSVLDDHYRDQFKGD